MRNPNNGDDFTPKLRNNNSIQANVSCTNSRGNSQVSIQGRTVGSGGYNNSGHQSGRRQTSNSGSNGSGVRSIRSG